MPDNSLEETNTGVGVVEALLVVGQVTLKGIVLIPAENFSTSASLHQSTPDTCLKVSDETVARAPNIELESIHTPHC